MRDPGSLGEKESRIRADLYKDPARILLIVLEMLG